VRPVRRAQRPEIAYSWRRSEHSGLDPSSPRVRLAEVKRASRLTRAAAPVIEEIAESMVDYPFAVMLADERACIIGARFGERTIARQIERSGGVPGRVFDEELTGTNSIGTVRELRRPLAVHGEEHYLESLKDFSCYGTPILHPITKRFVGLIDVSGFAKGAAPILGPLLGRAAKDIEARLLDLSQASELELFRRYQERTAHRSRPVLALGPSFVLANTAATDAVDPADYPLLRSLSSTDAEARPVQFVRLVSGADARVRVESVGARGDCVLLEIDPHVRPGSGVAASHARTEGAPQHSRTPELTLVVGEPGVGRTTEALRLAGPKASHHTAESASLDGEATWLRGAALGLQAGPCVFDDVDALSPALASALGRLLADAADAVVLICGTRLPSSPAHAALLANATDRTILPPLRDRLDELPELIRGLTAEGSPLVLAPSALEALRAHDWPGNLHELRKFVDVAGSEGRTRQLSVQDLPPAYRRTDRARRLSRLEKAERETIVTTLAEVDGNIAQAARLLAISRPTLYSRIRALGIAR